MKFKNSVLGTILGLITIIIFYLIAYKVNIIEYKVFLLLGTTWSLVLYIFAVFEYYQVNEKSLIHVKRLGFVRKEVFWKDINEIFVQPNKYFKAVVIQYGGILNDKSIVINSGVKNYKKLIKIVLDKSKDNPKRVVDIKVNELLR